MKKAEQKRKYEALKEIKRKLDAGLKTTFSERNYYNMNLKK